MSLVNCVGEAVGNDIKDDMNGLITDNSEPERIWDILNTKLYNKMNSLSCVADVTKRGRWKMVPVFDKETGLLYTFMRESRYDELKRQLERGARNTYHYVDCLVHMLNPDLIGIVQQLQFDTSTYSVQDTSFEKMKKTVIKILSDLKVSESIVKRHVLILFDSDNNELLSIRAVMIDRNMNIAIESNLNKYITPTESIIMDSIGDSNNASNNPSRGLRLSGEAIKRKKRNIGYKPTEESDTGIEE